MKQSLYKYILLLVTIALLISCGNEDEKLVPPSSIPGGAGGAGDTTPPTVVTVSPADGTINAGIGSILSVTFSEAVLRSTVTTGSFVLQTSGGTPVTGTVLLSLNGTNATFQPSSALVGTTTYIATLTSGISDVVGNAMAANYSWTFTTTAAADLTSPVVTSVTPTNGSSNISVTNPNIEAIFSEALLASSVSTTSFLVSGSGGPVSGAVTYGGGIATFTTGTLISNSTYTVTLVAVNGIKDLAGNTLAVDYNWSFTTAPTPTITTTSLPDATVLGTYPTTTLTVAGGVAPYTWSVNASMAPGLTVDASTGVISGVPTTPGSWGATFSVTDGDGLVATKDLTVTVHAEPVVTVAVTPTQATVTGAYATDAAAFVASFGTGTLSWNATNLPPGLSLNSLTGTSNGISGTPISAATYTVTLTVTDIYSVSASVDTIIQVNAEPAISTASPLTAWTSGSTANVTFGVTPGTGTGPYTWSSTPTPPASWLTLTGDILSGTEPGIDPVGTTTTFDITVTDANGVSTTGTFNLVVQ